MSEPIKKATLSDPTHQIPFKTKSPDVSSRDELIADCPVGGEIKTDLYVMARKDPVNTVLIADGVAQLGAKGYAVRLARLAKRCLKLFKSILDRSGLDEAEFKRELGFPINKLSGGELARIANDRQWSGIDGLRDSFIAAQRGEEGLGGATLRGVEAPGGVGRRYIARTVRDDNLAQHVWLSERAKDAGYSNLGELANENHSHPMGVGSRDGERPRLACPKSAVRQFFRGRLSGEPPDRTRGRRVLPGQKGRIGEVGRTTEE